MQSQKKDIIACGVRENEYYDEVFRTQAVIAPRDYKTPPEVLHNEELRLLMKEVQTLCL